MQDSIDAVKQAIMAAIPVRTGEQRAEFSIFPRGGDAEGEWIAVLKLIDDRQTSSGRYLDTWAEIRTSHRSELGAVQKLLGAIYRMKGGTGSLEPPS